MLPNLTELLQNKVGQTLTQYVTDKLQESPTAAGKAVTMALPALLGGLVKNHADGNKMAALFDLITGPRVDSSTTQLPAQETGSQLLGGGRAVGFNGFGAALQQPRRFRWMRGK